MSTSFIIEQISDGYSDKRFLRMKGEPYKETSYNPDDQFVATGDLFDDAYIPLSIQVGKNKYWSFSKAWGVFEFPNKKVTEMIREKFEKKYGKNNIITKNYIMNNGEIDKSYLLVIRSTAIVSIYLTTMVASSVSKEYINVDEVYIGVNNDPSVNDNIITNCGDMEQNHLIPQTLREGMSKMFEFEDEKEMMKVAKMELDMKLSHEQVAKFNQAMNDKLDCLSFEDVEFLICHFKSLSETAGLDISITSIKKDGTKREHNISDVIKKLNATKTRLASLE